MSGFRRNPHMAVIGLLILACAGFAVAQYNSDSDVYLQLESELAEDAARTLGVGELGMTLFDVQEGAHEGITDTSGEEVGHYYIWLCIGSECVPIDPFEFNK